MIGLVIVTHGKLADELAAAMQHVVGAQAQLETVCIGPEDDMEQRRQDIQDAIKKTNAGKGVIVSTDLFGGTPSNLSISLMDVKNGIEVIAGVNLPMLIKLAAVRATEPVGKAVLSARDAGRKYINVASELLKN